MTKLTIEIDIDFTKHWLEIGGTIEVTLDIHVCKQGPRQVLPKGSNVSTAADLADVGFKPHEPR